MHIESLGLLARPEQSFLSRKRFALTFELQSTSEEKLGLFRHRRRTESELICRTETFRSKVGFVPELTLTELMGEV